jgi:hypothetical protein
MRSFWLPARIMLLALAYVLAACGAGGSVAAPPTPQPLASDTPLVAPTQPPVPTAAASAAPLPTSAGVSATSQASAANILVSYHKTGGIAGVDETTNVYADGTIELRDRRGVSSAKAEPSAIEALQKLLDSPEFAALQLPRQPPAADQFIYELTVSGRRQPIVATDGADTPQVLRDVIGALEQLGRQAK